MHVNYRVEPTSDGPGASTLTTITYFSSILVPHLLMIYRSTLGHMVLKEDNGAKQHVHWSLGAQGLVRNTDPNEAMTGVWLPISWYGKYIMLRALSKGYRAPDQDGGTGKHILPPCTTKRRTTANLKTKNNPNCQNRTVWKSNHQGVKVETFIQTGRRGRERQLG